MTDVGAAARPTWDETFMELVDAWARRATCPRLSVGAIVVDRDHQVLASGYNGAPRGLDHCRDVGCDVVDGHCLRAVHAEANAILQAARTGVPLLGATLYTSHYPCTRCALLVAQSGIAEVVYRGAEQRADRTRVLDRAGVAQRRAGASS